MRSLLSSSDLVVSLECKLVLGAVPCDLLKTAFKVPEAANALNMSPTATFSCPMIPPETSEPSLGSLTMGFLCGKSTNCCLGALVTETLAWTALST